jgi:hypothetical protein
MKRLLFCFWFVFGLINVLPASANGPFYHFQFDRIINADNPDQKVGKYATMSLGDVADYDFSKDGVNLIVTIDGKKYNFGLDQGYDYSSDELLGDEIIFTWNKNKIMVIFKLQDNVLFVSIAEEKKDRMILYTTIDKGLEKENLKEFKRLMDNAKNKRFRSFKRVKIEF